jgi:hypothetical protein
VSVWAFLVIVYLAGVMWGLVATDARPFERIALSVLWPLGPLAFTVVIAILLAASLIAFPRVSVPALLVIVVLWWWIG